MEHAPRGKYTLPFSLDAFQLTTPTPRTPQDPDLRWESLLPALRVWGDALPKPSDAPKERELRRQLKLQRARDAMKRFAQALML